MGAQSSVTTGAPARSNQSAKNRSRSAEAGAARTNAARMSFSVVLRPARSRTSCLSVAK
jgi:hypothetical protein